MKRALIAIAALAALYVILVYIVLPTLWQLTIALRRAPPRRRLRDSDRALLTWMTWLWPDLLGMAQAIQPETILRWHRAAFKAYWRWKFRNRAGRPKINRGLRDLIQRMRRENPLWGASRIHGELLMLGFEVAQSTVSKYMARPSKPPSRTWKTFLRNHAEVIAAFDMCVVPTVSFVCVPGSEPWPAATVVDRGDATSDG